MNGNPRLLHLYPRELGINGDVGNVKALVARARWRGIEVEVLEHHTGGEFPIDVDLVHIGSGPLAAQRAVHSDLLRIAPALRELAADGVPVLAIAGGWQLLGHRLAVGSDEFVDGAAVFPTHARILPTRFVGEVVLDTSIGRVAGFENHSTTTALDEGSRPFGKVLASGASAAQSGLERFDGVSVGESIGTNLHGPLLPMNPALADRLLLAVLRRHNTEAWLADLPPSAQVDEYAARARAAIGERLGVRSS